MKAQSGNLRIGTWSACVCQLCFLLKIRPWSKSVQCEHFFKVVQGSYGIENSSNHIENGKNFHWLRPHFLRLDLLYVLLIKLILANASSKNKKFLFTFIFMSLYISFYACFDTAFTSRGQMSEIPGRGKSNKLLLKVSNIWKGFCVQTATSSLYGLLRTFSWWCYAWI